MRQFRIAPLVVLVLLLQLPHASLAQKLEENTNRPGSDFRDFDLPSPDPLLCQKACVEDEQCRSFTYLKPNTGPGSPQTPHCWLKNGIPAAKRDSAFVSGVVPEKPPVPLPPGKPGEWVVERTTRGGVAGRSFKLSVKSDGHFTREGSNLNKKAEGTVPAAALEKLNRAILAAKPATWKENYNRPGVPECCDLVFTSLQLDVCGPDGKWIRYSGGWIFPYMLPKDLEAVSAALEF
jgi:PAN domain